MNQQRQQKAFTLLQREVQEYRNSFLITPLVVGGLLILLMLASVLLANRITVVGDTVMDILIDEHSSGMNISITIDEPANVQDYVVSEGAADEPAAEEDWNFSRDWTFSSPRKEKPGEEISDRIESLNPVLNALHMLFLIIMLLVSINYLLATFYQDRRDRSVLFWKSMPVSEWEEVATKMAVAGLVLPALYVAVSILTQLAYVVLAILLVWRLELSPSLVVLENIDFVSLFMGQLGGWLAWALWTAPFYAWLLLSSCAARRSPLMMALGIPVGLMVVEGVFFGSSQIATAIGHHIPHLVEDDGDSMGFYLDGSQWLTLDYLGLASGLAVAGALLAVTAWLRKHRFEI